MENSQLITNENMLEENSCAFALSMVMAHEKVAGEQKEFMLSKRLLVDCRQPIRILTASIKNHQIRNWRDMANVLPIPHQKFPILHF